MMTCKVTPEFINDSAVNWTDILRNKFNSIAALGQIDNDAKRNIYTAFMSKGRTVNAVISIDNSGEPKESADFVRSEVERFNKLNSHLTPIKCDVGISNDDFIRKKATIVITYSI